MQAQAIKMATRPGLDRLFPLWEGKNHIQCLAFSSMHAQLHIKVANDVVIRCNAYFYPSTTLQTQSKEY